VRSWFGEPPIAARPDGVIGTNGSQCLVAGAEGIRNGGPLWLFPPWKRGQSRAVFGPNLLAGRSENNSLIGLSGVNPSKLRASRNR
jgi:hypothetical protein